MSNAIEIEAKALVRKEDYEKLAEKYKAFKCYTQTNFYIDTPDYFMRKEGMALRIREKDGLYEMTLKTPLSQGLLEKNESISEKGFKAFSAGSSFPENDIKRFLTMLDIDTSALSIKASLTTKRIDVPYEEGKLSIDENHYSDKIDYEIELEYNNEADAERLLEGLFKKEGIPFVLNSKAKVARALEAVK